MPWFEGSFTKTTVLQAPLCVVTKHFSDLQQIVHHTADLKSAEVTKDVISFVHEEQDFKLFSFQSQYKAQFTLDDDELTWSTISNGNTRSSGSVHFVDLDGATEVTYSERIELNLPVGRLMKRVVKPLVESSVSSDISAFFERMCKAI